MSSDDQRDDRPRFRFRLPGRSPRQIRRDIDSELEFHLTARSARLAAGGMPAPQAREQAALEFGDLARTRVYCAEQDRAAERRRRLTVWLTDGIGDLRLAIRSIAQRPLHIVLAVGTLALGLASLLAMSTVMQQLILSPHPFSGGDRIVTVWQRPHGESNVQLLPMSDDIATWRTRAHCFDMVEEIRPRGREILDDGRETAPVNAAEIEVGFFRLLHLSPARAGWDRSWPDSRLALPAASCLVDRFRHCSSA